MTLWLLAFMYAALIVCMSGSAGTAFFYAICGEYAQAQFWMLCAIFFLLFQKSVREI